MAYGGSCPFDKKIEKETTAEDFVQRFYGWVFFKEYVESKDINLIKDCFEENLYKNLLLKMSIQGDGEMLDHQFDYAPFLQSNGGPPGFKILSDKTKKTPTAAEVLVEFPFDPPNILSVSLIRNSDSWKIANIRGNIDLKKEVDEAAQYLKSKT
jgi:hypothetical protein